MVSSTEVIMTSTHLPPLNFGDTGLRISLFPQPERNIVASPDPPDVEPEIEDKRHSRPESIPPNPPLTQSIPTHPIPSLQDAFTESLDEATLGLGGDKLKLKDMDIRERRELLLAQERDEDPFDAKWRYRSGQSQHEVVKLISQISFGVYLLLNGMANSNAQVVNILQGHIDEVDEFLETALEDLNQAIDDLNGRIEHLKLPLANIQVFEQLLEDRNFRCEILEGNEKIDHVLSRTNAAMKQWDDDIESGIHSTAAFTAWLGDEEDAPWRSERPEVADIFDAMKGNAEGWLTAFDDMNERAQEVHNLVVRLTTIIAEMEKKAGEVSRRTWVSDLFQASSDGFLISPCFAFTLSNCYLQANVQPFTTPSYKSGNLTATNSISSSRQSSRHPSSHHQQPSTASGTASTVRTSSLLNLDEEFPLPGGLPLLPPARFEGRHANSNSPTSRKSRSNQPVIKSSDEAKASPPRRESGKLDDLRESPVSEEPLYVLQPRTYTPQPPEPVPSPMLKAATTSAQRPQTSPSSSIAQHASESSLPPQRKASIRQRVSQQTNLPEAIRIPPRSIKAAPFRGPSPNFATPRTTTSHTLESAYGSDSESVTRRQESRAGSDLSMSPPVRPQLAQSPRSDHQQYYRPVRASPHSPLQQRPHTATGPRSPATFHQRNQPSALGGMSTLSNVTNAVYDDNATTPKAGGSQAGERQLKKKKSAFGWFKKAFTMDENERAAFEARKTTQHSDRYYDANSPKFLDGRRIR